MFAQWLHGSAVAAGFFAGVPYWRETDLPHRAENPDAKHSRRPKDDVPAEKTADVKHAA